MSAGDYVGTDRRGVARSGHADSAARLAERAFKQGWLWLRITNEGRTVGAIELSDDLPRHRVWWAES